MTAQQIIQEITTLPPEEQVKVVDFARQLDAQRQLTGKELGALADRLVNAKSKEDATAITNEMVRGFYGNEPHA